MSSDRETHTQEVKFWIITNKSYVKCLDLIKFWKNERLLHIDQADQSSFTVLNSQTLVPARTD